MQKFLSASSPMPGNGQDKPGNGLNKPSSGIKLADDSSHAQEEGEGNGPKDDEDEENHQKDEENKAVHNCIHFHAH